MNPEMIDRSEEMIGPALNPAQTATPNDMTEKQASTMRYIQGPGMVEHMSGDESTSQASSDGHRGSLGSIAELVSNSLPNADLSAQLPAVDYDSATNGAAATATVVEPTTAASTAGISIPQPTPFLAPSDQMELDQNFFSFFGDMNTLADGSMADLDDWSSFPTDLLGLSDNFNWQTASATDTATML